MDAKGQERSACEEEKQALKEKMEDLHRRMHAFHDKVATEYPNKPQERTGNPDSLSPANNLPGANAPAASR